MEVPFFAIDMVFESFTKSLSSVGYKCIQEDTFVPNLVQTGREMAVKSSREKKKIRKIDGKIHTMFIQITEVGRSPEIPNYRSNYKMLKILQCVFKL